MGLGWGGAPLQAAPHMQPGGMPPQRFRSAPDEYGGGARGARGGAALRGRPGPPHQQMHVQQHQQRGAPRHSGDPRQKNQGYRRLWQQVTQVRRAAVAPRTVLTAGPLTLGS